MNLKIYYQFDWGQSPLRWSASPWWTPRRWLQWEGGTGRQSSHCLCIHRLQQRLLPSLNWKLDPRNVLTFTHSPAKPITRSDVNNLLEKRCFQLYKVDQRPLIWQLHIVSLSISSTNWGTLISSALSAREGPDRRVTTIQKYMETPGDLRPGVDIDWDTEQRYRSWHL